MPSAPARLPRWSGRGLFSLASEWRRGLPTKHHGRHLGMNRLCSLGRPPARRIRGPGTHRRPHSHRRRRAAEAASAVLAAGSRVWRTALCECAAGGGKAAAAVARSLEGHSLPDVQTFLRLLYDQSTMESLRQNGR